MIKLKWITFGVLASVVLGSAQTGNRISSATVVDSHGVTVGNGIIQFGKTPLIWLTFTAPGYANPFIVTVSTPAGFDATISADGLFYKTSDCSGTAYRHNTPPSLDNFAVLPYVAGPRVSIFVYSNAPGELFAPQSKGVPAACTTTAAGSFTTYYPQTHLVDLYDWFTPPFSFQLTTF
jgi:hypothetical protein